MKLLHVLVLAVVVSVAASVLTVKIPSGGSRGTEASAARPPGGGVDPALEAIRREQAALREALERLESSARMAAPGPADRAPVLDGSTGLTVEEVEAMVARALQRHTEGSKPEPPAPDKVAAALQRLLDPNLSEAERVEIWDELAREGMLDAVVAEYERRVEASPQDSTAHADLGFAYHQKMRFSGGGLEAGKWGKKGSDAYAKALELDETNWDARFAQAQHFYYADMSGDAFQHLKVLREQQKNRRPEERHAQAFLFLGNMYLEQGNSAEARKVWQEGLALFPSNERLRELAQAVE